MTKTPSHEMIKKNNLKNNNMAAVAAAVGGVVSAGLGMVGANQAEKSAKGERNRANAEKKTP